VTDYKEKAKELLKKATLSESWKNPKNQTRYALMIDGEIIGYIREKVDLSKLSIGKLHKTWRGDKVELMYNDECVGFLWV